MRIVGVVAALTFAGVTASQSLVGVWKPGLKHGKLDAKQAASVKQLKSRLSGSSMKLNKDKTFGCVLLGRIMRGTWTLKNGVVTLNVKEVVGMSMKQVAALKPGDRTGQFKVLGKLLLQLPAPAGKPQVLWKRTS